MYTYVQTGPFQSVEMQVVLFSVYCTKVRNLRHFSPRSKQILVRMGWDGIVLKHDPAKLLLSHCTKIAQWGLNLFLGSGLLTPVPKFIPWHHSSIIVATKANPYKNHSLVRFQPGQATVQILITRPTFEKIPLSIFITFPQENHITTANWLI